MKEIIRGILINPIFNSLFVKPLRPVQAFLPASVRRLPVCGKVAFTTPNAKTLAMHTRGLDPIASRLFWSGAQGYEPHITKLLPRLCANTDIIIDVGANTGFLSMMFASLAKDGARVFSFEPVPRIHEALRNNITQNQLSNCQVFDSVVGDTDGETFFYIPRVKPLPQSASLKSDFRPDCDKVTLKATTLDNFVKEKELEKVGLIKIDVEASAAQVIKGMQNILKKDKPEVLCEILPEAKLDEISTILKDAGYSIYFIDENALVPVSNLLDWRFRGDNNFLLSTKPEKAVTALV